MSDHGELGEEAPALPLVHPGVQGRDRGAVRHPGPREPLAQADRHSGRRNLRLRALDAMGMGYGS